MRRVLVGLAALALTAVTATQTASASGEKKTHGTIVLAAVDQFAVPHLKNLDKEAKVLAGHMSAACNAPGDAAKLSAARDAFGRVTAAWTSVEFLRAGPITSASRLERFFFWPDPRGTTARQLAEALAKHDGAALAPAAFVTQSVAVQGLTALEYLLFDDKHPLDARDEAASYRCAFATAIAANLATISGELVTGWDGLDGFRIKLLTPGSDNPLYKDSGESARDIVKAVATGLELASARYAAPEIDAAAAKPPKRARIPFDRSGLSEANLAASIDALEALFNETGLAAFVPADKPWMDAFIPRTWGELHNDVQKLTALRGAAPGDKMRLAAASKLKFDLNALRQVIVRELAPNADLTLGFNELDGD